jgi:signal transduction histidine kinase
MVEPLPTRSLLRRISSSSVLAAAVGAAIAAATGGIAIVTLVEDHGRLMTLITAERLAAEIEEEEIEEGKSVEDALQDELADVEHVGSRGVVYENGVYLAGNDAMPRQPVETCEDVVIADEPYLSCTIEHQAREITLAVSIEHLHSLRPIYGLAMAAGVIVGMIFGALLGGRAVRWGLGPFNELRARLRRVEPHAPRSEVLEPPAHYVEIEELRRAMVDLVDQFGAAVSHAQRFAAQASHELRTPLTTIAGELELLAETAPPGDAPALAAMRARVTGMTQLVERLLVLAVPRDPTVGEAVDLADVANDVAAALPDATRRRVAIRADDDVLVRGDATLLQSALSNAVDNALKYSTDTVELRVLADGDDARIEVLDHGPGVPASERERVFEPFYRAGGARQRARGSGIGLAIIAHVARGHGGRAELFDAGPGVRLRITLPRWPHVATRS